MLAARRFYGFILLLTAAFALASCAGLDSESWLIGEETEKQLGAEYHQELLKDMPEYAGNPQVNQYVRDLGMSLVPHTHRPQLGYTFTVVDTDEVNAFAVMGGYVYVTTGLLKAAKSGAEVASVLAHELGHVSARHGVQSLEFNMGVSVLSELLGAGDIGGVVASTVDGLAFSKDDEREADALGVEYAHSAAYNPWGMVDFFEYLDTTYGGNTSDPLENAFTSFGEVFSTHPPTPERISNVKGQLGDLGISKSSSNLKWESSTQFSEIKGLL